MFASTISSHRSRRFEMRNPHTRSAVATDCDAVGVELFRQLQEQAGVADASSAHDRNRAWPREMLKTMNATELRLVLSAFERAVRADLAARATLR